MASKNLFPNELEPYKSEIVQTIQLMLEKGLPMDFIRSCVRVDEKFQNFSGGFKSDLVGSLTINVNSVIKLGQAEIPKQKKLMEAVELKAPKTFAKPLRVFKSAGSHVMLMENLSGYDSLFNKVYLKNTKASDLRLIVRKCMHLIDVIHKFNPANSADISLGTSSNPFFPRIENKIKAIIKSEPKLEFLYRHPGNVMGVDCPPLDLLLDKLKRWLHQTLKNESLVLTHGDPHLGNILSRRYGKGFAVRFIDPNPEIGFSYQIYDYGKLLHWADPVGWAIAPNIKSRGVLRRTGNRWNLKAEIPSKFSSAAERRRTLVEAEIYEAIQQRVGVNISKRALLNVSVASAHLGLAQILGSTGKLETSWYVLAYALKYLARWYSETN